MTLVVRLACLCAILAGLVPVIGSSADAATRRVLVREVTYRWLDVPTGALPSSRAQATPDDRLYRSCRRKIRRDLGPARGRHTSALRLAFTQRCVASNGTSW